MKSDGKGNESISTDWKILFSENTTSRNSILNYMQKGQIVLEHKL